MQPTGQTYGWGSVLTPFTMKPRYTRQLLEMDCFPAAMANMFKWAGKSVSYKEERFYLYKLLKFDYKYGTDFADADKIMKVPIKGLKVVRKENVTYKSVLHHLREGGSILFSFKLNRDMFHASLVVKETKKCIVIVNYYDKGVKETISYISKNTMRKHLNSENLAYFVTKVTND